MDTKSYLSFAEDDYSFLSECRKSNMIYNGIAAIAQNCCEKYLKYLVDTYYNPDEKEGINDKKDILRAHSLRKILNFIEKNMEAEIDGSVRTSILKSDGYYFTSRYPGEDSIEIGKRDLDDCYESIDTCREFVNNMETEIKKQKGLYL